MQYSTTSRAPLYYPLTLAPLLRARLAAGLLVAEGGLLAREVLDRTLVLVEPTAAASAATSTATATSAAEPTTTATATATTEATATATAASAATSATEATTASATRAHGTRSREVHADLTASHLHEDDQQQAGQAGRQ